MALKGWQKKWLGFGSLLIVLCLLVFAGFQVSEPDLPAGMQPDPGALDDFGGKPVENFDQ